jgi:ATP-binding cassette subfamily B protein
LSKFSTSLDGLRIDRAIGFVWQAAAKWTVVSAVSVIIQSVATLATLYIFKLLVDQLTGTATDATFANVMVLIVAALGLTVLGNLGSALGGYVNTIQTLLVADHMQGLVQAKSIDLDLAYYENSQYYDKLHRAQREAPVRPLRIIQSLTELGRNGLTLLGALALLLAFHWGVVLAVLAASLPVLVYRLKQADALYELRREQTASERLSGYFNQLITTAACAKEVRAFGFGPLMIQRFRELRSKIRTSLRRLSAQGYRRQFVTESSATLAGYGALAFVAHAAVQKTISLGEMVMYFGAFQVAVGSLRPTLTALAALYENNLFLSTLHEFLAVPRQVPEPTQPREMPRPWQSGLRVENLRFRYPDTERWVLDDISLTIRPGETVALVGRNGSGKTTLTKLLCRLYDPNGGRITVDGIDLRDLRTADLRREISIVYQDFGRYHLTAGENIRLGRPELGVDDPALIRAAQWAGIHDHLISLPQGYETVLGRTFADGAELSIGQWQKLALARTFVRDSQLILLDEPTSSLDAAAEFEFFEKFREMARGRSALIISHRFSTVRLADRIYVLDGGRLIEEGNHEELVAHGGLYAQLYRQQAYYYQDQSEAVPISDENEICA